MSRKPHWLTGSIWNLLGTGIPFGFAIVCMPLLLKNLGADRYGMLILAWGVVGYFSIFDFGLSRAITQLVARAYRVSPEEAVPIIATGVIAMGVFGYGEIISNLSQPEGEREVGEGQHRVHHVLQQAGPGARIAQLAAGDSLALPPEAAMSTAG